MEATTYNGQPAENKQTQPTGVTRGRGRARRQLLALFDLVCATSERRTVQYAAVEKLLRAAESALRRPLLHATNGGVPRLTLAALQLAPAADRVKARRLQPPCRVPASTHRRVSRLRAVLARAVCFGSPVILLRALAMLTAQRAVCLTRCLCCTCRLSRAGCRTIVRCTAVPCNRCVLHLAALSLRVALGASAAGDAVGDVRVPGARRAVRCAVRLKPHL
jgi:hypothetical protein